MLLSGLEGLVDPPRAGIRRHYDDEVAPVIAGVGELRAPAGGSENQYPSCPGLSAHLAYYPDPGGRWWCAWAGRQIYRRLPQPPPHERAGVCIEVLYCLFGISYMILTEHILYDILCVDQVRW